MEIKQFNLKCQGFPEQSEKNYKPSFFFGRMIDSSSKITESSNSCNVKAYLPGLLSSKINLTQEILLSFLLITGSNIYIFRGKAEEIPESSL